MSPETVTQILNAYDMFEEDEPDISTERLLQQTADFCECDVGDVADALLTRGVFK